MDSRRTRVTPISAMRLLQSAGACVYRNTLRLATSEDSFRIQGPSQVIAIVLYRHCNST